MNMSVPKRKPRRKTGLDVDFTDGLLRQDGKFMKLTNLVVQTLIRKRLDSKGTSTLTLLKV